MECSVCKKENANSPHIEHGMLCQECFDKKPPCCDFCSSKDVRWSYNAKDFIHPFMPNTMSIGAWAACDECRELIESSHWSELAVRSIELLPYSNQLSDEQKHEAKNMLLALHAMFAANRIGEAQKEQA